MWMMGGYNEAGVELSLQDSTFNPTRRLRPLLPRPSTTTTTAAAAATPSSSFLPNHHSCLGRRIHAADLHVFNHHLANLPSEQGKRDLYNSQQVLVSSRWNPTPEQLLTLEELYRQGTRTPSAEQIQQITAQLRRYGKIEGKNVFYWFQNHKARERQKRRRQLDDAPDDDQQYPEVEFFTGRKEPGVNRTGGIEVEQMINKSWALATSCCTSSTLPDQRSATLQMSAAKAVSAGGRGPEFRSAGGCWVEQQQFYEREQEPSHERRKNATWQQMQLSSSSSHPQNHLHLLNPTTTTTTATTTATPFYTNTTAVTIRKLNPNLTINNTQHLLESTYLDFGGEGNGTSQTLELFPLRSGNNSDNEEDDGATLGEEEEKDNFSCDYQFFEFLPLKN